MRPCPGSGQLTDNLGLMPRMAPHQCWPDVGFWDVRRRIAEIPPQATGKQNLGVWPSPGSRVLLVVQSSVPESLVPPAAGAAENRLLSAAKFEV
jgi:hypothetical protein